MSETVFHTTQGRIRAIIEDLPGTFGFIHQDADAPEAPFHRIHKLGQWAVEQNNQLIEAHSQTYGVDPNIIKSIIYYENSQGWYDSFAPGGLNSSIRPANINPEIWGGLLPGKNLHELSNNIEASVKLVSEIIERIDGARIEDIYSLYNSISHDKTDLSGGEFNPRPYHVREIFASRAWESTGSPYNTISDSAYEQYNIALTAPANAADYVLNSFRANILVSINSIRQKLTDPVNTSIDVDVMQNILLNMATTQSSMVDDALSAFGPGIGNYLDSISDLDAQNITFDEFDVIDDGITLTDANGVLRHVFTTSVESSAVVDTYGTDGVLAFSYRLNADGTTGLSHHDTSGGTLEYSFDFSDNGQLQLTGYAETDGAGVQVAAGAVLHVGDTQIVREGATDAHGNAVGAWATSVRHETAQQHSAWAASGQEIGAYFGSTLGQVVGGDDIFVRVGAGTALGTLLGNVGESLGGYFDPGFQGSLLDAVGAAFDDFDVELFDSLTALGTGAVASFLTGELVEELGIGNGLDGQLLNLASGTLIGQAVQNLAGGVDVLSGVGGLPANANFQAGLGGVVGSYLANEQKVGLGTLVCDGCRARAPVG